MGKTKGLIAWIFGLLAGTALGVLFAPRKGTDTRLRIKKARQSGGFGHEPVMDDVKKLGEEIAETAIEAYNTSELSVLIERWRKKLKNLGENLIYETSVTPLKHEAEKRIRKIRQKEKKVKRQLKTNVKKIKRSAKVAKKAVSEIKKVFKSK